LHFQGLDGAEVQDPSEEQRDEMTFQMKLEVGANASFRPERQH
jgi:hypothetical protein